ncbi:MAG: hypothetical protein JSW66_16190 [Phycisphaerales bacterium]|nr:MAG: hypothetical protein JSW66_16190 [Phycisphaerales bacterium]
MAKALGLAFDRDYYFDPDRRYVIDCRCNEYAAEHFTGMRLFYSESNLGQFHHWDKSQVQIGGIQPNLILGMCLGADFVPQDDLDADITPGCLAGRAPGDLPEPESLLGNEMIKRFDEQIRRVQGDSRRSLRPIPPFFWDASGRAAIHGVLTTAQKFLGETILLDMMAEPRRSAELMGWIGEAYIVLVRHFSQAADLPVTGIHVGECSSCMVSPQLIETFVMPATSKIGEQLGPIRFHSCGPSTRHLQAISKIKNLCSLDLGGDTSVKRARELLGNEMLISASPLPQDLSATSTEPILRWAEQLVGENAGGNMEFVYHVEADYNMDTICALTDFVKRLPDSGQTC